MPKLDKGRSHPARRVALFRNGRNQAVRIPKDFELPGGTALLSKEGEALVIEPIESAPSLLQVLSTLQPIKEAFPDVDEGLADLDEPEI